MLLLPVSSIMLRTKAHAPAVLIFKPWLLLMVLIYWVKAHRLYRETQQL